MNKKSFENLSLEKIDILPEENSHLELFNSPPENTLLYLPEHTSNSRSLNFSPFYGRGHDQITIVIQKIIEHMIENDISSERLSVGTITTYFYAGIKPFLNYCYFIASSITKEVTLTDITPTFINQFIQHLNRSGHKMSTQKKRYDMAKSVLVAVGKANWLQHDYRKLFPRNPFPAINTTYKSKQTALSTNERKKVSLALSTELKWIRASNTPLDNYQLTICLIAVAFRTGINLTPLLELPVDCLQPHPLKNDRRLLISYKRRGKGTHITSLPKTDTLAIFSTVMLDVEAIITLIVERNFHSRKALNIHRLFVYQSTCRKSSGKHMVLGTGIALKKLKDFTTKHKLCSDDGRPLVLNVSRLRKTFINRIFTLSGQDPIATAAMGNHSLTVSNNHYLEAPPESEKNFSLLAEIRVKEIMDDTASLQNTPIAKCMDSTYGHRAPKNGSHCTDFLACFRCKSCIITRDDLFRLYSLYWLLIEERGKIGGKRWKKYYSHIIRVIDREISPQFPSDLVNKEKIKAKHSPHPYWKTSELIEDII